MAIATRYSSFQIQSPFLANGHELDAQFGSEVVGLSNGGFAVVYGTDRAAPSTNDFPLVTFYDENFERIDTFIIPYASNPINMVGDPEIIELANGNVAVVWDQDAGAATGSGNVVGAIINPISGAVIRSQFDVSSFAGDTDPEATSLINGKWLVTMTNGSQIQMQIMNANGSKDGSQISTGVGASAADPVITALSDGGWVVAYTNTSGANDIVYGSVYNADGTIRADDFVIGDFGNNTNKPAVAALKNGNWAIVYKDDSWGTAGLTLEIFSPDGIIASSLIRVDTNLAGVEDDPDITVLENGFIVVSWTDQNFAGEIVERIFTPAGADVTFTNANNPTVITFSRSADTDSSISAIANGVFAVTWTNSTPDSDGDAISGVAYEIKSTITSNFQADILRGSALRELMIGNGGSDDMFAGNGDDRMFGGNGNEMMFGGGGDDEMYGEGGIDTMRGGIGDDYMEGGVGIDDVNGGSGNDEMYGNDGNDVMNGAAGDDVMYGGNQNDRMGGQAGMDTIRGEQGNDFLAGGDGNDVLFGDDGDDRLYGQSGNDRLLGGNGNDYLNGDTGRDKIYGGSGDDNLFGGNGNDDMDGDQGNDFLVGGAGNDFMRGGWGDDSVRGDDGFDTFVYYNNFGNDRLLDFENDIDTITLTQSLWSGVKTVAQVLEDHGTQVHANRFDLDFGGGNYLIITGRFGAGVTAADLLDDMFV